MIKLIKQLFRFGIVGVICFLIDYLLMVGMTELLRIDYLISGGISFTVSTVVNYLLSMWFVFQSKKDINKVREFLVFTGLSIIGLGINEGLMWICVEKLSIFYMIAKIIVTAVVMLYNFITRKLILEDRK